MTTHYRDVLKRYGACNDALRWLRDYDDPGDAWDHCDAPSWHTWAVDAFVARGLVSRLDVVECTYELLKAKVGDWGWDARKVADPLYELVKGVSPNPAELARLHRDLVEATKVVRPEGFSRAECLAHAAATAVADQPAWDYAQAAYFAACDARGVARLTASVVDEAWVVPVRTALRDVALAGMARAVRLP